MLNLYIDDSGSHEGSEVSVIGGYLMSAEALSGFDVEWRRRLKYYGIPVIHRKDFGRFGKLRHIEAEKEKAIFADAVRLVREYCSAGVAGYVLTSDFQQYMVGDFDRTNINEVSLAFMLAVHAANAYAGQRGDRERINIICDSGSRHGNQFTAFLYSMQHEYREKYRVGTLTFADDEETPGLQAADMIAYEAGKDFSGVHQLSRRPPKPRELLLELLGSIPHVGITLRKHQWIKLGQGIHPLDVLDVSSPKFPLKTAFDRKASEGRYGSQAK